jgi:hypothetical protein
VLGRLTDCDLFGGVAGAFSAVLDAEEVVGRIMRARNPSSAGAVDDNVVLDGCFFKLLGGGPSDGRLVALLRVDGFLVGPVFEEVVARLGDLVLPDWIFPDALLRDCLLGGGALAVFDPEEAVCAVRDAGSLTGFVGDFGLGLWNPVCGGDGGIFVFTAGPCACAVGGRLAGRVV